MNQLLIYTSVIHGDARGCFIKPGPGKVMDLVFLPNFISDFGRFISFALFVTKFKRM